VYELIVIGASWGGLEALSSLLDGLHDNVHQPIVVALHRC
jgi:chemotaxis response regulator CheB